MPRKKIYLRNGHEYVGPFYRREDAVRFLILIESSGESSEGIEIVELDDTVPTLPIRSPTKPSRTTGKRRS